MTVITGRKKKKRECLRTKDGEEKKREKTITKLTGKIKTGKKKRMLKGDCGKRSGCIK